MRLPLLFAVLVLAPSVAAQPVAPHALPFASAGNALELALGGGGALDEALAVEVAAAPAWLRFAAPRAQAERGEAEPVARLLFDVDRAAPVGEAAQVVLRVVAADGAVRAEHTLSVAVSAPEALALSAPRPNPSRGTARLDVAVPEASRVRVSVVDVLGREVQEAWRGEAPAGGFEVSVATGGLASGLYVVRVVAEPLAGGGGEARVQRLTVAR